MRRPYWAYLFAGIPLGVRLAAEVVVGAGSYSSKRRDNSSRRTKSSWRKEIEHSIIVLGGFHVGSL